MSKQLVLRSWRTMEAEPDGLMVWFDPTREQLKLYELDPPEDSGVGECCEEGDHHYEGGALDQVKRDSDAYKERTHFLF